MKIALIGYGQMGKMIEAIALEKGYSIVARTSSTQWDEGGILQADVCIEFTRPECAVKHVERLASLGKNIVIGTTGWDNQIEEVRKIVEQSNIGLVYSPNFSIGVQLMFHLLQSAGQIFGPFKQYDVAGIEYHHNKKKDQPSGTALEMGRIVSQHAGRDMAPFTSVRCGAIPGTHTLMFDSPFDTISITHEARTREGFALGAIQAAEWLNGKKGFYSFSTCIQDILERRTA